MSDKGGKMEQDARVHFNKFNIVEKLTKFLTKFKKVCTLITHKVKYFRPFLTIMAYSVIENYSNIWTLFLNYRP